MRKLTVAAAIVAFGLSCGTVFAATPTVWEGSFAVRSVTANCTSAGGLVVGDFGDSVFRPKLSTGDSPAGISFLFSRSASLYESTAPTIPIAASSTYGAQGISGHAKFSSSGGFAGTLTITARTPPTTIIATTPFVTLIGTITNFDNISGCTIGFKSSYFLR